MPKLTLTPTESAAYSGRPGLGIRMFLKGIDEDLPTSYSKLGLPLYGVRRNMGPGIMTNPVVGSHHQALDGFVNSFPGLSDGGTFDFDANFYPDFIPWQRTESWPDGIGGFMKSLMSPPYTTLDTSTTGHPDSNPMMQATVVLPQFSQSCWCAQGFAQMAGPFLGEMEGIMQAPFSMKISGRPYLLVPKADASVSLTTAIADDTTGLYVSGGRTSALPDGHYMVRHWIPNVYEIWTDAVELESFAATGVDSLGSLTSSDMPHLFGADEWTNFKAEIEKRITASGKVSYRSALYEAPPWHDKLAYHYA